MNRAITTRSDMEQQHTHLEQRLIQQVYVQLDADFLILVMDSDQDQLGYSFSCFQVSSLKSENEDLADRLLRQKQQYAPL